MRYLSVCSGIEAASVAWDALGWECAGVAEIDPFPSSVLRHRLGAGQPRYMPDPAEPGISEDDAKARAASIRALEREGKQHGWGNRITNFGDFTQIRSDDVGPIDLLVGGTPCQSFSVAGKRLGLDDPRGNLTLEFLALAKRLRPRWLLWENVPGVLSHNEGRTFGTFLGLLAECGFDRAAWRVLDAQYVRVGRFGRAVPQRRRRLFLVGYSGTSGIYPRAVLFDRESLFGNPAPRREAGQRPAPTLAARTRGGGGLGTDFDCDGGLITGQDWPAEVAPTLNAHFGEKQGLEDQHIRGGADSSSPPVAMCLNAGSMGRRDAETETLIPTFGAVFDDAPMQPVTAFSSKDYGADATEDISPTLRASDHSAVAYAIQERAVAQNPSSGPDGIGVRSDDVAYTLEARQTPQAVAFSAKDHGGDGQVSAQLTTGGGKPGQGRPCVAAEWQVRRLTPRECERLQAFPDDWTTIPWNGKDAENCPDGPRYKACGNSMAVNVMTWLGERIAAADAIGGGE